jgi:hypothetical protein
LTNSSQQLDSLQQLQASQAANLRYIRLPLFIMKIIEWTKNSWQLAAGTLKFMR